LTIFVQAVTVGSATTGWNMAEFDDLVDPDQEAAEERFGGIIKAAEDEDFEAWQEAPLPSKTGLTVAHQTVIKRKQVATGPTKIIKPEIPVLHDADQMEVEPIMEDEAIIGIRVSCRCGANHEILFDYK